MSDTEYLVSKIEKYVRHLKEGHKIGHALHMLDNMDMTVELLTRTAVGKVVNKLRDEPEWGGMAQRIVEKWKETARQNGIHDRVKVEPVESVTSTPSSGYHSSRSTDDAADRKRKVKEEVADEDSSSYGGGGGKRKVKEEYDDESYSKEHKEKKKSKAAPAPANAFLAALSMADKVKESKPKKLKPFDLSLDIDPNYRPMPIINVGSTSKSGPGGKHEDLDDPARMFKPRTGQTKIFAGRRKAVILTEVPRLYDICIRMLQNHINDIDSFGDIPYHILKPILEKCTAQQLMDIERRNPYLEEDTHELWERLVQKHHAKMIDSMKKRETWKEMFLRCQNESANRLKMLSERISQHGSAAEKNVRKAVAITDVRMPRGGRRMGATSGAIVDMPSALHVSKARKEIFDSGSKHGLTTLPSAVRNLNSSLGSKKSSSSSSSPSKRNEAGPKKGALMAKTFKMLGLKSSSRK